MISQQDLQDIAGRTVYDINGDKIGKAAQVYLDDATGEPAWVTVNTGIFGTRESFVPLSEATLDTEGIRVPYEKAQVKDAPRLSDDGHIEPEEEERLYTHYGLATGYSGAAGVDTGIDAGLGTSGYETTAAAGTTGYDTSGPTTDEAMTRSEERLDVSTQRREAGRARLRKYVVTEEENVSVPVRRERVRVETEPITDANRGAAMSGPEISEEEHEVVLHEEQPVVTTEAVPVERVRLGTEEVTETERVSGQVRKERIDLDADQEVRADRS